MGGCRCRSSEPLRGGELGPRFEAAEDHVGDGEVGVGGGGDPVGSVDEVDGPQFGSAVVEEKPVAFGHQLFSLCGGSPVRSTRSKEAEPLRSAPGRSGWLIAGVALHDEQIQEVHGLCNIR